MNNLIPWRRTEVRNNGEMQPVSHMRWGWDRLFDQLLDDALAPSTGIAHALPIDVSVSEEHIRVRAEVPGVNPEELNISLTGDVLTLSGQKVDQEAESRAETLYYTERRFGSYQRAIKLPVPVDPDQVSAEHKNGVVTITLQKSETVRPKRIKVKSA
jgi:HSP20 family protein